MTLLTKYQFRSIYDIFCVIDVTSDIDYTMQLLHTNRGIRRIEEIFVNISYNILIHATFFV